MTSTAYEAAVIQARQKLKGYMDAPDSLLSSLTKEHADSGLEPLSMDSARWFTNKTLSLGASKSTLRANLVKEYQVKNALRVDAHRLDIGNLYFFQYSNPKTKATLEYYDEFPLVMIINVNPTGFFAINFHYLLPTHRTVMLEFLLNRSTIVPGRIHGTDRLMINYAQVIQARYAKGCYKNYLASRINSQLMVVPMPEWEAAINLPVDSFVKAPSTAVWGNTLAKG